MSTTVPRGPDLVDTIEKTYALSPPEGQVAASVSPVIEQRLFQLGFVRSATPAFLVEARATQRPRQVGAFVPAAVDDIDWVATPRTRRTTTKRSILTLSVRILDTATHQPVYAATASLPRFKGAPGKAAPDLALAALEGLE